MLSGRTAPPDAVALPRIAAREEPRYLCGGALARDRGQGPVILWFPSEHIATGVRPWTRLLPLFFTLLLLDLDSGNSTTRSGSAATRDEGSGLRSGITWFSSGRLRTSASYLVPLDSVLAVPLTFSRNRQSETLQLDQFCLLGGNASPWTFDLRKVLAFVG